MQTPTPFAPRDNAPQREDDRCSQRGVCCWYLSERQRKPPRNVISSKKKNRLIAERIFLVSYCTEHWNTIISDLKRWSTTLNAIGFAKTRLFHGKERAYPSPHHGVEHMMILTGTTSIHQAHAGAFKNSLALLRILRELFSEKDISIFLGVDVANQLMA